MLFVGMLPISVNEAQLIQTFLSFTFQASNIFILFFIKEKIDVSYVHEEIYKVPESGPA